MGGRKNYNSSVSFLFFFTLPPVISCTQSATLFSCEVMNATWHTDDKCSGSLTLLFIPSSAGAVVASPQLSGRSLEAADTTMEGMRGDGQPLLLNTHTSAWQIVPNLRQNLGRAVTKNNTQNKVLYNYTFTTLLYSKTQHELLEIITVPQDYLTHFFLIPVLNS